ncbi:mitochondrial inner membrane protein [Suhomyces tanzawaensis NRRL Y-17324]|uniref:Mitochondrial escape protein 2 n=1 Tax=Suhomyces tanzawaensis NRRL Y-17324 TaxID=984487 RepID=A0A1E4SK97_9ASCO|nr:mitochondrial inner membrane protein [Suhomyces tanzawaensis NRRL Y-17324]ODV79918.1 mitochondrial inner membrane protein [Suhomyces tanzawaensis NRRL Y-17324]
MLLFRAPVAQAVFRTNGWRFALSQAGPLLTRNYSSDVKEFKQEADTNESDDSASTTGVIDQELSETVLYFDHVYPWSTSNSNIKQYLRFVLSPIQNGFSKEDVHNKITKLSSPLPLGAKITDLVPLQRDCGAFVKFQVPKDVTTKDFIVQIKSNLQKHRDQYNQNIFRKVFNKMYHHFPSVYAVKGTPWIEDLRRFPSLKLKVIFEGPSLTEEELYVLFRRYGLIVDIIPGSESATLIFRLIRSAICAKNCVTGITLNKAETTLHLQYIPIKRVNYIADFVINHQRIAIPVIIALLATIAVLIFDPIREWCIEQKITKKFYLSSYKDNKFVKCMSSPFKTIKSWLNNSYDYIDQQIHALEGDKHEEDSDPAVELKMGTLWSERFEKAKQLKLWIYENINTYIVIKGPKGSGKEEFVLEHALTDDQNLNRHYLVVNCDALSKSRSDSSLIRNASNELGYFPVFTWANSISQFIDLGVQGLTGQKSGLSESKESQIKNMFSLTSQAIRKVALADYEKYKKSVVKKNSKIPEGQEMIQVLKEDEYLQHFPEVKPIIVVNHFARKSESTANDFIYPMVAEWTSNLIQNNLAHVIYITSDVGSIQHLNDSLPNQVFKTISLSDASRQNAKQYLLNQLKLQDSRSIEGCLEPLGGRMLDLQSFVRRIKSGEAPQDAIEEMVSQAAEQITTFFLNNHRLDKDVDNNWTPAQIWTIMKLLTECGEINYEKLVNFPLFNNSDDTLSTLSTLEKFDLISLTRDKGMLDKIQMGRPLFNAAFKNLIEDLRIYKMYEIDLLQSLIKVENAKIKKHEEELIAISTVGGVENRLSYLTKKIESSNSTVVEYESKIAEIKKMKEKTEGRGFFKLF